MIAVGRAPAPAPVWPPGPAAPRLGPDEVHVWRLHLDRPAEAVERLAACLSADEVARARRYRFRRDRDRFVAARGLLRTVLGRYLGADPGGLRFRLGPHGKPALAEPAAHDLRFNLAHSDRLALLAVGRGREVGIDVERIRPDRVDEHLARLVLAPGERAAWRALPADRRAAMFFACWTAKEAFVKATGHGLARPLDAFEVRLTPGPALGLVPVALPDEECRGWSLRRLEAGPDYAASLCVEGHAWRLDGWGLDG